MNPDLQIIDPSPAPVAPSPTSTPHPAGASPPPSPRPERRAQSKIGRLTKATRDKLNSLIRDGVPFADIPPILGDPAKGITARDLSRWHRGPHYQRWVLEQDWLQNLRADQESAFDLLNGFDSPKFSQAALQLAVTRLFLALRHIDSGDLNQHLGGNAQVFARLVHALARACREATLVQKFAETSAAQVTAAQLQPKDPGRELSDNEFDLLVDQMDQVFKVARRRPKPATAATPTPTPPPSTH